MQEREPADEPIPTGYMKKQYELAMTVPCTYCGAQINEPCRNKAFKEDTQLFQLTKFPAHLPRIKAATILEGEVPF